jgi:transcriptional regulator with XRE-family HTH domain
LSQADLGKALGVSYQQVQKYEIGRDQVSVSLLLDMMRMFGVSADSLLGGLGRRHQPASAAQKHAEEIFLYAATRQGLSVLKALADASPEVRHSLVALIQSMS